MPAISVTSVSTTTEELTATAHGLLTGDRFRLRNVGGALPAATPALAGATDYFAVVTGVNTLKVSDTNAHALAGTNIVDITGAGSGTTTIEYDLPYCIPTATAAPGTQVKSANLNAVWNALVALYCLLTGQAQSIFTSVRLAVPLVRPGLKRPRAPVLGYQQNWGYAIGAGGMTSVVSSAAGTAAFPLDVDTGDVVTGLVISAIGDGAVDVTYHLLVISAAMVATDIGTITDTNRAAAWGDVTVTVTSHTMADGETLVLNAVANAANAGVGNIRPVFG